MKRIPHEGRIIVSTLLALLLLVSMPMSALAATWDISKGDITVNAESGGQTVRQGAEPLYRTAPRHYGNLQGKHRHHQRGEGSDRKRHPLRCEHRRAR